MSREVDLLREAATLMRKLAENTTEGRWELGRTSTVYMDGTAGYVLRAGGKPGIRATFTAGPSDAEHMIAWDPAVGLAVASLLEKAANDYKTAWDTPECPGCADSTCPPHGRAEYHADGRCEDWVSDCLCLAPFVTVAREFLRREAGETP